MTDGISSNAKGNSEAIEAWNTVLFDKFLQFRDLLVHGLGEHGRIALSNRPYAAGMRVVDVGCGFGDSTAMIAEQVGPRGLSVGIDCAQNFIDCAVADFPPGENLRFAIADVETEDLGGPFDGAYSRFGTMFFANPVAALRNVHRSLVAGSTMTMVVWRKREDNEWLHTAEMTVRELLGDVENEDGVTCGPGPFSMASADYTSTVMAAAGFSRIGLERVDCEILIGRSIDEAVDFALSLGPAGEVVRLSGDEGVRRDGEIRRALAAVLEPMARGGSVYGQSSSWIATGVAA